MPVDVAADDRPPSGVLIEACITSVDDARAAEAGGADRLELNRDLARDGLTPSTALLRAVLAAIDLPTVVMVRPHDRGFAYSRSEVDRLRRDAGELLAAGAAGIAVGPLTRSAKVHPGHLVSLVETAEGADVVFHRAFDRVADVTAGLECLIEAGVTRVLTSGQAVTAREGIPILAGLVRQARGRIEILPGAGVGPDTAGEIVRRTGCRQLHGTFRDPNCPDAGTDTDIVARVRAAASASPSPPGRPGEYLEAPEDA
jgi:copper homeostasis protein